MNYVLVDIREVHKKPVLPSEAAVTVQDIPTATHTPLRATVQDLPTATHTPLSTATAGECLPHERPIPKPRASVGDSISHGGMNNARVVGVPTEHSGVGELPCAESSGAAVSSAVKSKSTRAATVLSPATIYPATCYPATIYPATSYPATIYPATIYPATCYPATIYPATSYPATSYPATSYPATSYQAHLQPLQPGFVQPSSAGLPSAEPSYQQAPQRPGFVQPSSAGLPSAEPSYQQAPQRPGFVQPSSAGLPSAEPSYQQAPQRPGFVQPSSAGLPRGAGLTLPSAAQCQVKPEQATAAPAIPHPPTLSFVSSPQYSSLVAPAQQPLSSSGLFGATPLTGLKLSSAQPSITLNLGTPFFGAASTIPHITPVFPDPRVEPPGRAFAIDDQSVPQFVAHSMPGSRVLGSVGVSQATTAAAPVQVQPAEVPPPTPIGFKIVNVVVKSSIQ